MLTGGFDLNVIRSSPEAAGRLVTDGGALFSRLFGSEVPVIVACSGHAVAAGALLLLGADYRVGARGAFRIGLIETQIGMVLPRWAVELARERISPRHFQQATVGARMYDPDGAADAGFLDAVVEPDELLAAATAEAQRWAEFPRGAYRGQVLMNRGDGWPGWPMRSPRTAVGASTSRSEAEPAAEQRRAHDPGFGAPRC